MNYLILKSRQTIHDNARVIQDINEELKIPQWQLEIVHVLFSRFQHLEGS